jgi:hypothetical protein
LATALKKTPADPSFAAFPFDVSVLDDGWTPPLIFPLNLPEFPPALRVKGHAIEVALFAVISADPARWVLKQDVPISYPAAPPNSFYARYQAFLAREHATLATPQPRQPELDFAPGVLRGAVDEFMKSPRYE